MGRREAAPQGAPASSRERLRVPGAPTPRGSSLRRLISPGPRPWLSPASTDPDGTGLGRPARAPSRSPSHWLPTEPSAGFLSLPAASSPKRLWSWRVPCTVPLGKISRWKPVRQYSWRRRRIPFRWAKSVGEPRCNFPSIWPRRSFRKPGESAKGTFPREEEKPCRSQSKEAKTPPTSAMAGCAGPSRGRGARTTSALSERGRLRGSRSLPRSLAPSALCLAAVDVCSRPRNFSAAGPRAPDLARSRSGASPTHPSP